MLTFGDGQRRHSEHLADSTLLYALTFALDNTKGQLDADAISSGASSVVDPTLQMFVSGQLFFDLCRLVYDQCGPQRVFFALQDALVDQWTPIGVVFGSADTPITTTRRLGAYQNLAHRSCISEIHILSDQSVQIRRHNIMREIAETTSQAMAFWGYLASAYKASGCRGIRLETAKGALFANGEFNALAIDQFVTCQSAILSWERVVKLSEPVTPRFRAPCHKKLISAFADHILELFASGEAVNLATASAALGVSPRTLQRRLKEANLSLCRLRRALQLYVATGVLAEPDQDLVYAAIAARFSDAPHLIRIFRAATGMPPREFADRLLI